MNDEKDIFYFEKTEQFEQLRYYDLDDFDSFIAIDLETANADMSSICQIGIAFFEKNEFLKEWVSYINPEDEFDPMNVTVHGIDQEKVAKAPIFSEVASAINSFLSGAIVVSHTHFDRVALRQAFENRCLNIPRCFWLDSARIERRAWTQFAWRGYGLKNVC